MANTVLTGFRWVKGRDGGARPPIEERAVASGYATAIFRGDAVKLVSDGTIAAAAAGDAVYGVADGVVRFKESGTVRTGGNYLPASTTFNGAPSLSNPEASIVRVIPARAQIFEADYDTAAASITAAQTLMFNNADLVATAGSTTTGRSGYVLNGAAGVGTATAQFRLLEIAPYGTGFNDVTAANWKVLCEVNEGTEPLLTATGT